MKSLSTLMTFGAISLFSLCVTPVGGATVRLSDFCSECPSLAKYLNAELNFSVVGDTLTLDVTNLTPQKQEDPAFKINKIYFNVPEVVDTLSLTDVTGPEDGTTNGWNMQLKENGIRVSRFGRFDVSIAGGHGIRPPVLNPGQTAGFTFQITGTGPFSDSDFITLSSPVGNHPASYAAAKFYNDCTSAYGATNVPEPATASLLVLASLMLLRKR